MVDPSAPPPGGPRLARREVGGFQLESVLGSGAMGVVYRATAPDGRPAAVKMLKTEFGDRETAARFKREAETRILHPNVVEVLGAGTAEDGAPYIAFELLEGESLAARLARGPLPMKEVVELGVQACHGLAAAHRAGFVHRDLKPANLFLTKDGTLKLVDFGIALWATSNTRLTGTGAMLGTPAYLSPEQARGETQIDGRADLWALGALLYEAVSGKRPFERPTILATIVAVMLEEVPPLPETVAPALALVIERALAKAREDRWPDADAFAEALTAADLGGRAPPAAQVALPAGESRVVAVILAHGVRHIGAMQAAVEEAGGDFLPLYGGRAIGLFGARAWEGDEIRRAATAALAMRGAANRIALSSGRATRGGEGIAGDALRKAEAALAAGLSGVVTDAATARGLADAFVLDRVNSTLTIVTGKSASGEERRGFTVGRRAELAQMSVGIETVLTDRRAVAILVSGPTGIGKTRLRYELLDMVRSSKGTQILFGRATPRRSAGALSLFAAMLEHHAREEELLRGWASMGPAAGLDERRRAVLALAEDALGAGPRAIECAAFLGELLGVAMPASPMLDAARADPQLMTDRLALAVHDWLAGMCDKGPVALVLEDLHWTDPASLDLLDDALGRLAAAPLLVFATTRPELLETRPRLFAGKNVVRVEPRGLSASEVATLAAALVSRPLPDALVRSVTECSAGNPLFVEQLVLELRDQRRLDDDGASLPLPVTVEAAVQSRIDHLPPAEKGLCMRAAILRRPFTRDEVEALGVPGAAALLSSLTRRDFLSVRVAPKPHKPELRHTPDEFRFRSSLVAEVAYRMIGEDLRSELHRRAGTILAATAGVDPEEIAWHQEHGGETTRAAAGYTEAALIAARRGDSASVLRCSGHALALGAPTDLRFALHMARSSALQYLGRRAEQATELAAAIDHASSDAERARASTEEAVRLSRIGKAAEAQAMAETAVAAARRAADAAVLAVALGWYAVAMSFRGHPGEARTAIAEALQQSQSVTPETRALVAHCRANVAAQRGDLGDRIEAFRAAAALYGLAGDVRRAAGAEANLADTYNRIGWYAEADVALRTALEGLRRVGNRLTEGYTLVNRGYSLSMLGRHNEALAALAEAAALATAIDDARLALAARVYRVRVMLAAGPSPEVTAEAGQAAGVAQRLDLPGLRVTALTLAARARLLEGDAEAALALSTRALALRDEMGGVEEDEAEVYLTHARALAASGRAAEAATVLQLGRARVMYIAGQIADPALQSRFLHGVAAHRELLAT